MEAAAPTLRGGGPKGLRGRKGLLGLKGRRGPKPPCCWAGGYAGGPAGYPTEVAG